MDFRFLNVVLLGFAFMLTFTAFQTMAIIEQTILQSISAEDASFTGSGYLSLAIIYAVLSVTNWLAPSAIALIGAKFSMFLGSLTYLNFIASFLRPSTVWLYCSSALLGLGGAFLWAAQGNYLTIMSGKEHMARNSGIFWALFQCSLLFGNLYVFFQFSGQHHVPKETRDAVTIVLAVVCALGSVLFLCLKSAPTFGFDEAGLPRYHMETEAVEEVNEDAPPHQQTSGGEVSLLSSATGALKEATTLFCTRTMLLLCLTFFYAGLELSFFSGVYSTCIGNTNSLPNQKSLVGLSGMLIGVGEIIGGGAFGVCGGALASRLGRISSSRQTIHGPVVMLGFLAHSLAFLLIFLNLPADSVAGPTWQPSYISGGGESSAVVALACSLLLGLGDACYNTQIFVLLGILFSDRSASAFAIFKFVQSLAAAGAFFYSAAISLHLQLLILAVFGAIGSISFWKVDLEASAENSGDASDGAIARRSAISKEDLLQNSSGESALDSQ